VDLTIELAAEYGVTVDRAGYDVALAEQRARSRTGKKAELARHAELTSLYESILRRAGETEFLGYETTEATGRIVVILRDGIEMEELTGVGEAEVVLHRTPFYGEGGGQVGDRGILREEGGGSPLFDVEDTQKPVAGLVVHRGRLHGRLRVGETVDAMVDADRRARTMRNHTGTHLLHRALRNVVGPHAKQAGSLVAPEYLRFDFPLDRPLTDDEKRAIEAEVRRIVREDRPLSIAHMGMAEAIDAGADAFFDEKYGERVRTVRVQDYSFELCGGTHCRATGQIGGFFITGERSIGAGMRRIEAVTGEGADAYVAARLSALERVAEVVGAATVEAAADRAAALQEELRETRRRLRSGGAAALPKPSELAAAAEEVAPGVRLIAFAGPFASVDAMKGFSKDLRAVLGSGVIALGLDADAPAVWVTVSEDLLAAGISAGSLVRTMVGHIDGKGGGRPEMAQGMGTRRDGLAEALAAAVAELRARDGAPG
jgi:alanyl-tRNA synthetase